MAICTQRLFDRSRLCQVPRRFLRLGQLKGLVNGTVEIGTASAVVQRAFNICLRNGRF